MTKLTPQGGLWMFILQRAASVFGIVRPRFAFWHCPANRFRRRWPLAR